MQKEYKIGFDAKRAFFNRSGLGNYSRTIIRSLEEFYPETELFLFSPEKSEKLFKAGKSSRVIVPQFPAKLIPSLWRSYGIHSLVKKFKLDVYHGLSHELPKGIEKSTAKKIVSIHDLIFLRYPEFYKSFDRWMYTKKIVHACSVADSIIAISEQTKEDLMDRIGVSEQKIKVLYQSCHPSFFQKSPESILQSVREKYNLPKEFILMVGTIEERKNHLMVLKAIKQSGLELPLVVVGRKTPYYTQCKTYIRENRMDQQVQFIHDAHFGDLPALYQLAFFSVYMSVFEGFGLPVLESLVSGCPVLTSNISSMPEAGGQAALYADPLSMEDIASKMTELAGSDDLKESLLGSAKKHCIKFTPEHIAHNVMELYS